jgi:hypothetical protein
MEVRIKPGYGCYYSTKKRFEVEYESPVEAYVWRYRMFTCKFKSTNYTTVLKSGKRINAFLFTC